MRAGLLMLGAALLVVAWFPATLPFGAPDETAHYLRALNIANGHILGPHIPYTTSLPIPPLEEAWASRNNRAVTVPARLNPPNVPCLDGKHNLTEAGSRRPIVATIRPCRIFCPPWAWASRTTRRPPYGWPASAPPSCNCLPAPRADARLGRDRWSVLGFLAAISPAVLCVSAIMNPSGMQIAACLAFMAALIRILGRRQMHQPGRGLR